jgi:hypothetical protein
MERDMRRIISLVAAITMLATSADAQSLPWPEPITKRLNDLNDRFLYCSAFFSVVAYRMDRHNNLRKTGTRQKYIRHSKMLRDRVGILAAELDVEPKAVPVRWELHAKKLLAEMHEPSIDFSTIVDTHLGPCSALTDVTRQIRKAILGH